MVVWVSEKKRPNFFHSTRESYHCSLGSESSVLLLHHRAPYNNNIAKIIIILIIIVISIIVFYYFFSAPRLTPVASVGWGVGQFNALHCHKKNSIYGGSRNIWPLLSPWCLRCSIWTETLKSGLIRNLRSMWMIIRYLVMLEKISLFQWITSQGLTKPAH